MNDKVVLITGATDGIGRQAALDLARQGAIVLVHGRSEARCQAALAEISAAEPGARLEPVPADLSSLAQVRALAAEVQARYGRLDVLVNNAGVFLNERRLTEDGLETTFAVNHLAHFLLTRLLLDALQAAGAARIITLSSGLHRNGVLDLHNLQGERHFSGFGAYALSKLCNVLFTYALAERLAGTGVTANAMHPGGVATKLLQAATGGGGGLSVAQGADTVVYLASAPEVAGVSGKYFLQRRETRSAPQTYDRAQQQLLWQASEKLAGLG